MKRAALLVIGVLLLMAAPSRGAVRILLAGVEDYRGDPLPVARLLFADKDRRIVGARLRRQPDDLIVQIPNQSSNRMRFELDLNRVIAGAKADDVVCLFISARGIAKPRALDGYILMGDSSSGHPESTGIPVSYIRALIKNSAARRFLILADVSRDPAPKDSENNINALLAGLSSFPDRVVEGLLGSRPGTVSLVDPTLPLAPEPAGFGLFSYYLAATLQNRGSAKLCTPEMLQELKTRMPAGRQTPAQFGPRDSQNCKLLWPNIAAAPSPVLIASRSPRNLLLAMPQLGLTEPQASAYTLPDEALRDPARFTDELLTRGGDWMQPAAALASEGQKAIVRYGTSDLLPGDPLKVDRNVFGKAAAYFEAALQLIPNTPEYESFRSSIEGRRIFCSVQGQPASPGTPGQLAAAATVQNAPVAEIENATGVYYLERTPNPDLRRAIEHFRRAAELSPFWGYPKHNLALALAEAGDYRQAEQELRRAIAAEPYQPYLHYNLGLLLERSNRRKQARDSFRESLRTYEEALLALYTRASEWSARFPPDSKIAVERFEVFSRNRGEVLNALGTVEEADGRVPQALGYYAAAESANARLCAARYNRARLLERQNDPQFASLDEENARVCPDFHPSLLKLAAIAVEGGDEPRARTLLKKVLAVAPTNLEATMALARLEGKAERWKQAVDLLEKVAAESMAVSPGVYEQLGDFRLGSGDQRGACAEYRKALDAVRRSAGRHDQKRLQGKVVGACR